MDDDEIHEQPPPPRSLFEVRRVRLNVRHMRSQERLAVLVRQTVCCQWQSVEFHGLAVALLNDIARVQKRIRASQRQHAAVAAG